MNCCCLEFDERADVCQSRLVRARKDHKCGECNDGIKAGSLYEVTRLLFDGSWSTHKTCARCANVRDEYFTCGAVMGSMAEDFEECFGFDYRDGIPPDFAPCKGRADAV